MNDPNQYKADIAEVKTDLKHLSHDIKNLGMKIDGLVTRREYDGAEAVLSGRISKLEERHEAFHKWLWGAWLTGAGVVATLGRKAGLY